MASLRDVASSIRHPLGAGLSLLLEKLPGEKLSDARPSKSSLAAVLDALYLGQQLGLATGFGLFMRSVQMAMNPHQPAPGKAAFVALAQRYRDLLDADLRNAEGGFYPRGLLFQFPLLDYLLKLPALFRDGPGWMRRFRGQKFDELPAAIERADYPNYYLRNFHWQTDGWLSERSAAIYDFQVELLFGGTADVMRRMAIPPAVEAARRPGKEGRHPRVLDLACGTGRFLLQLHRALPEAKLHGVDLSPYYVAHARRLHEASGASVSWENAESLPFADESFDVVTSVFLFHELPSDARRNVLREAYRVLAPSGRLVLLDAAQNAESEDLGFFLEGFSELYHEPYFKGYLKDDLAKILSEIGFEEPVTKRAFVSKLVVANKPNGPSRARSA